MANSFLGLFRKEKSIDHITHLEILMKDVLEEDKCIWYHVMLKDEEMKRKENSYHCADCDGIRKDCKGYVPKDFYKVKNGL